MRLFKVTWFVSNILVGERLFTTCGKAEAFLEQLKKAAVVLLDSKVVYAVKVEEVQVSE